MKSSAASDVSSEKKAPLHRGAQQVVELEGKSRREEETAFQQTIGHEKATVPEVRLRGT